MMVKFVLVVWLIGTGVVAVDDYPTLKDCQIAGVEYMHNEPEASEFWCVPK